MSPVIDVSVKKNSLLVCVLKFLGFLAGHCSSVEVITQGPGKAVICFIFSRNVINNRSKIF